MTSPSTGSSHHKLLWGSAGVPIVDVDVVASTSTPRSPSVTAWAYAHTSRITLHRSVLVYGPRPP